MSGPLLEFDLLYTMFAELDSPINIGSGPEGHRMAVMIKGGHFEGPKLKGKVTPGIGGDWLRIRPDGSVALDVRANLETDDGAQIYTHYQGRAAFQSSQQMKQVLDFTSENPVPSSEYYLRTNPLYETSHEKYVWMNSIIAVGIGALGNGGITYTVYEIK